MPDVSSRDILQATGIRNGVTLTRWYQQNLIPPPDVRTHPDGRGKMGYWPEWVLLRCVRIRQMQKTGLTLDDIGERLGDDWAAEAKRFSRQYHFKEVSQRMDRLAARDNLEEALRDLLPVWWMGSKSQFSQQTVTLISESVIEEALVLMGAGMNPVLILTSTGKLRLTADFAVGEILSRSRDLNCPLLVIPIFDALWRLLRGTMELPEKPLIRPLEKVEVTGPSGQQERRFVLLDDWSIEVEPPIRQKQKKRTGTK